MSTNAPQLAPFLLAVRGNRQDDRPDQKSRFATLAQAGLPAASQTAHRVESHRFCTLRQVRADNGTGRPMKILVCGAGVIGTLYAARLQEAGHHVTVLARGSRRADIQRHGLVLEDIVTGARSVARVSVTGQFLAEDSYDMVLVTVRRDQLSGILPDLALNRNTPSVLFMLNNPSGSSALIEALGPCRVMLGFPGAGGTMEGYVVYYRMISQQPTTIGEPNGKKTARLQTLFQTLRACGFRVRIDNDMDAWLTSHAFFVTSVSGAIYLAGGDCRRLSRSPSLVKLMVDGVHQGFRVVRALGRPVHPLALNVLFTWLPQPFAVHYWRRYFSQQTAEFVFARHARHASAEMQMLAMDCRLLFDKTGGPAPSLVRLYSAIDDYVSAKKQDPPTT
jgi:2-dehydropantoate 2-reductase